MSVPSAPTLMSPVISSTLIMEPGCSLRGIAHAVFGSAAGGDPLAGFEAELAHLRRELLDGGWT